MRVTATLTLVSRGVSFGFRVSKILESIVARYKMKDKLYPDTSVPEYSQKRFFRRVPGSLGNGTRRNGNPDTPTCFLISYFDTILCQHLS